jgi:hypothetical protein
LPFKRNLRRYVAVGNDGGEAAVEALAGQAKPPPIVRPVVGLCTLNQVDPYPITYSLSNP